MSNLSFFSIISLFFLVVFLFKWFSSSHKNLPPSPPKLPIIGNLHQIGSYPHRSLRSLAQKYGEIMLLHLGSVPVLIISSSDAAREIFKTHDLIFSNKPNSSIARKLLYNYKDVVFSPYGEYWRQTRSFCVMKLLSNQRVLSFQNVREEETTLMIEKIREFSSSSKLINLSEMFAELTNDIVCRVALGRKYSEGKKFKELLEMFVDLLGAFNVEDYIPWLSWINHINGLNIKVEKLAKELDDFMEYVVEEHMESGENEDKQDFVNVLLDFQEENEASFPVHRDTIKALILDMLAAGIDTTYAFLDWAMAELLKHPKVMKKLQNEVREKVCGKSDITEDDLGKLQYLKAVIKESLRLHSAHPFPRESTQDVKIMGYDIAAGTQLIINSWAIARDPMSWDKPDEFRPERFLNSSLDFKGRHFELLPFGAGRRGCPGIVFATSMIELALAKLVCHFDFALPDGGIVEDLDMTESSGSTSVHKKSPVIVVATPYYW